MFCMQCHNDLSECTCADLEERLKKIFDCSYLHIFDDAKKKYMEQAKKNKERADNEIKLSE